MRRHTNGFSSPDRSQLREHTRLLSLRTYSLPHDQHGRVTRRAERNSIPMTETDDLDRRRFIASIGSCCRTIYRGCAAPGTTSSGGEHLPATDRSGCQCGDGRATETATATETEAAALGAGTSHRQCHRSRDTSNFDGSATDATVRHRHGRRRRIAEQRELRVATAAIEPSPRTTRMGVDRQGGRTQRRRRGRELRVRPRSGQRHTFEHTFEEAGVYTYACTPHKTLGMKGAVVVTDADGRVERAGGRTVR